MNKICFKIENRLQLEELERLARNELKHTRLINVLNGGSYSYGLFYLYLTEYVGLSIFTYSSYDIYEGGYVFGTTTRIKSFSEFKRKILKANGIISCPEFMTKKDKR